MTLLPNMPEQQTAVDVPFCGTVHATSRRWLGFLNLIRIMYYIRATLVCFCVVSLISGCGRGERVVYREGDPDVFSVDSDDSEMNAAISQARQTTDVFLRVLAAPKSNQTDFSVKRPYSTKDGSSKEHIWISQISYDGTLLHGMISDDPVNIPNLKIDDAVIFSPSELSDWMYLEDGKIVGGYTIRIWRKHMSAKDGADFDKRFQFKP